MKIETKCPEGEKPSITKWTGTEKRSLCCTKWAYCKRECMVHNVVRFDSEKDAIRAWENKHGGVGCENT